MAGKIAGKKLVKWTGTLLTSAIIAFSSLNACSQINKENQENHQSNNRSREYGQNKDEEKYKLNLQYNYSAIIVDNDRASDLEESFNESFYDRFSLRRQIRDISFEEDGEKYIHRVNRSAISAFEHGLGNFLRSSEPGVYIEHEKRKIEDRLKAELAKIKIRLGSEKEARFELDAGIRFNIPNTYAYLGTDFAINGGQDIARAELRAMPAWLDARLKTRNFYDFSATLGARSRYSLEDDAFVYWRIGKYLDQRKTNKAYDDYFGIEGRIGRFKNGFMGENGRGPEFDSQLLVVGKLSF